MRPWKFAKPKNPGFGIDKRFYLSVLAARAQLPSIVEIVSPDGAGGAVVGFGAPLAQGATKDDLKRPLARGAYVLSTKDRATVLKMLVISKEEAGFDPSALLRRPEGANLTPELRARIGATWTLMQLTFESHDAMVYPALDFILHVCRRLADLSDGVVADPLSEVYLLPEQLVRVPRVDPKVDAREHVAVHLRTTPEGLWAYTLGLQKFSLPEIEIQGLDTSMAAPVESLLLSVSQTVLLGRKVKLGDRLGAAAAPLEVGPGGLNRGLWEGVECFELLPAKGADTSQAVAAWAAEAGAKR